MWRYEVTSLQENQKQLQPQCRKIYILSFLYDENILQMLPPYKFWIYMRGLQSPLSNYTYITKTRSEWPYHSLHFSLANKILDSYAVLPKLIISFSHRWRVTYRCCHINDKFCGNYGLRRENLDREMEYLV